MGECALASIADGQGNRVALIVYVAQPGCLGVGEGVQLLFDDSLCLGDSLLMASLSSAALRASWAFLSCFSASATFAFALSICVVTETSSALASLS